MIASHNSWSYARPQWYLLPFAFMARCQSKTIREQYDAGIRFFDLHVRWIYDKGMMPIHGMVVYKANIDQDLEFLNKKGDCSVRVLLDLRTTRRIKFWYHRSMFRCWMGNRMRCYDKINFLTARDMPDWEKVFNIPDDDAEEYHASKAKNRLWCLCPWLYAKTHKHPDTDKILLVDFV